MKKRIVILTGAGAVLPWKAPTTTEITKKICLDTTFRTISGQPIGAWLYDKLCHFYHRNTEQVNFETILNCLECLENYYACYLHGPSILSDVVLPIFFREKDGLEELLCFDRIYEKAFNHGWQSHNERFKFYGFWSDFDKFFGKVRELYVSIITNLVLEYETKCFGEEYGKINVGLNAMLNDFSNGVIRNYTLNYDSVLPKISNVKFFEGFSDDGNGILRFDSKKVLNDQDVNTFYSLHGNISYEFEFGGNIIMRRGAEKELKTKPNFIAGLNKSGRILEKPYSQFYHAFYRDCFNADLVIVIGYSFADSHINRAIIEGSSSQSSQQVWCIGYDKLDNEINFNNQSDYDLFMLSSRDFEHFMGEHHFLYKIGNQENKGRIFFFKKGFENFLEWEYWKKIALE